MTDTNQKHLETLLRTYQRRLQVLENQSAQLGIYAPPHIVTEIEDVQAKIDEIKRQLGLSGDTSGELAENASNISLSGQQINALVNLLLDVPSIGQNDTRDAVVQQLPTRIINSIVRSPVKKVDVLNIVRASLNYPGGLDELIRSVRFFDEGTSQMRALDAFMERL